jgi:hypothetical protein
MFGSTFVNEAAGREHVAQIGTADANESFGVGVFLEPGVTLVGEGVVAIPNFTEEQVRFLDERRRLANHVRVMERVGGRSSRTSTGGARTS